MYNSHLEDYSSVTTEPATDYRARIISRCTQPSAFSVLTEGKNHTTGKTYYSIGTRDQAVANLDLRHNAGNNILYADGHVTSKTPLNEYIAPTPEAL